MITSYGFGPGRRGSRPGPYARRGWTASSLALAACFAFLAAADPAGAGSYVQPDVPRPDSTAGELIVETAPPGLLILIDEVEVGRSPVGPLWIEPKTVRVRAIPSDPNRFDMAADVATARVTAGTRTRVFLDLRPSVLLRSDPEPARVTWVAAGAETLLGETPLRVRPARLERGAIRFSASECADSTVDASLFLRGPDAEGATRVALRRVVRAPAAAPASRSILRSRPLQWTLIGVGAGLTVAAAAFKREGDRWYDRYLESSDVRAMETYFDRAERNDRLAIGSLSLGQILFTGGLALLVNGSR